MPPSRPNGARATFYPPSDNNTYRDLLFFEERLKTNAALLKSRKSRYQAFLFQLVFTILVLASDVWLDTEWLTLPLNIAVHQLWSDQYHFTTHQYLEWAMLLVAVTTLVLFFASGTYAEKIGYANKYVPHANRALRSFNMYFNVRPQPLKSYLNPTRLFSSRQSVPQGPPLSPRQPPSPQTPASPTRRAAPLAPIPPATNPRGELIFSSRVDSSFRESYERYRMAFEKRREEKETIERALKGGWLRSLRFWKEKEPPIAMRFPKEVYGTSSPDSSRRSSPAPSGTRTPRTLEKRPRVKIPKSDAYKQLSPTHDTGTSSNLV